VVLHGHKGDGYHYAGLEFLLQGKPQQDSELDLQSKDKTQDPKSFLVTGASAFPTASSEVRVVRPTDLVFAIRW